MFEQVREKKELWDLFTKKEEYNSTIKDQYDRFPYYLSNQKDVFIPNVSKFLVENGLNPLYPDGKKFAVCLTHDIDFIYPSNNILDSIYKTSESLIKGNFIDAFKMSLSRVIKDWNTLWNFKEIMKLEAKYNAKSSFYFLALEPGDRDFSYNIKELKQELDYISSNGWEVGLHGGHESFNNFEDILRKKRNLEETLGKKVIGYRNHFLRFTTPDTWELLSKAGFKYDTTYGYNDCAGFRNGMCHPFKPFNLETNTEIDIMEIPLIIMDNTLLQGMRLDFEKAWKLAKNLIDTVEQYCGVITVLWHNSYMHDDYLNFYKNILQYCSKKDAWITSGEEIYNWWNDKYYK